MQLTVVALCGFYAPFTVGWAWINDKVVSSAQGNEPHTLGRGVMITAACERQLVLEGAYNVRDIGGYATTDARSTRWRSLLRGDSLHWLS